MRRDVSLQSKLLLGILPCGVGFLFIVVGLGYYQLQRFAVSALKDNITAAAGRLAEDVNHEMEQCANYLMTLAQNPLFLDYFNNKEYGLLQEAEVVRQGLEEFLGAFAGRVKVYSLIFYVDAKGSEICRIGRKEDPAGLIYFSQRINNPAGDTAGVLTLGYNLEFLSDKLQAAKFGGQGFVWLEDVRGAVIAGEKPAEPGSIVAMAAVKNRPWIVRLAVAPGYFLSPLRKIRNLAVVVGFLTSTIAVMVIARTVRSVSRPIQNLVEATRGLAAGNLDVRVTLDKPREIGVLAAAFNDMALKLKEREKEQKNLQQQLIQSEKLSTVGQLISGIAHELNNPLNGVTGYAELLLEEDVAPQFKQDLKQIYAHAMRCRRIIENLLFFVRQGHQEKKSVDLNKVIRSVIDLLGYRFARAENIVIEFEPAKISPVEGDFQQLEQVVVNLVQNAGDALKESPPGRLPKITIKLRQENQEVFLSVADNGKGIAAGCMEKIFEPFFTTKEPGMGTGLGLAIARQIVKDHSGAISCRSVPGGGAAFTIGLPALSADKNELDVENVCGGAAAAPKKVLVIDDETEVGRMMVRLLGKIGHQGEFASSVDEALEKMTLRHYDLILVDLEMPGKDGRNFYDYLSKNRAAMTARLIFMTGDVLSPSALEFFESHKMPYLAKPFGGEELFKAIARRGQDG